VTARLAYAIVFVTDMTRSIRFYRDVLDLPLRFESPHWTEFDTGGATLALHLAVTPVEAAASADDRPGTSRPGISVADLDAFHARMLAQHVRCVQEPRATFGKRIAQYADPDGLVISVSQHR
jgi:lactoylglutathione lyase